MTYAEELVKKWQHVITDLPIPTWTENFNLACLAEYASKSELILEHGVYCGISALVMLRANPKCHIWCSDWFKAFEFNKDVAAYVLRDYIKEGRCELIQGTSDVVAQMLPHMRNQLDLVFVDAAHDTLNVMADIKNFMPLLKPGHVMLGHDFDEPYNDVALGVIQSGVKYDIVTPRMWRVIKQ